MRRKVRRVYRTLSIAGRVATAGVCRSIRFVKGTAVLELRSNGRRPVRTRASCLGDWASILVGIELVGSGHCYAERRERVQDADGFG